MGMPGAPNSSSRLSRRASRLVKDLRPGEQVVSLQRQHTAALLRALAWPLGLALAWLLASLLVVLPFIASLQPDPLAPPPEGPAALLPSFLWIAWLVLGAALVLWAAYAVLDWSDDWIALTTTRIIIMDKALFFREMRREVPLGKVQNVVATYPNGLGVALDFGDLTIDTAGVGVQTFPNLPHPREMREAIFTRQQALRASQPAPEDRRRAAVRGILYGTGPTAGAPVQAPHPYAAQAAQPPPMLASLFPVAPRRDGDSVTWHRHWFFLLRGLFLPAFLWLAVAFAWSASLSLSDEGQRGVLQLVLGWVGVVLAPVCLFWALWRWANWRNDLYMLDRERVYDIERLPFGLREQSKETLVTRITDVTYLVPGPLAHMLNYGDVYLKTPGESTEFTFRGVPCPREVQREIIDRVEEYRQRAQASADKEIEAWLRAYHDAQQQV